MIDKEAFTKMKDGVVLLNFARDLLVDEDALVEALDSGKVKKYVTDFANATGSRQTWNPGNTTSWCVHSRNLRRTVQLWQSKKSEISSKTEISKTP